MEENEEEDDAQVIKIVIPKDLLPFEVPSEARLHARRALREWLLALRSLIDAKIVSMDRKLGKPPRQKAKVKKIKIE